MGNQQSTICSIETFVISTGNEKDLSNLKEDTLLTNLHGLFNLFKSNPSAYTDFKTEEEKQTNKRFDFKRIEAIEDLDMDLKNLTKSQRYQFLLTKILNTSFKDQRIHLLTVKLMSFIMKESDFLQLFLKQSLDIICTKIINIERITIKPFIIVGTELLDDVMNIFINDSSLFAKNLLFLTKIYNVCKKLNEKENLEDPILCISFAKVLKSSVLMLTILEEQSKSQKVAHKKEYQEFIRNILNEYNLCSLFGTIANAITEQKIGEIDMFKPKEKTILDYMNPMIIGKDNDRSVKAKAMMMNMTMGINKTGETKTPGKRSTPTPTSNTSQEDDTPTTQGNNNDDTATPNGTPTPNSKSNHNKTPNAGPTPTQYAEDLIPDIDSSYTQSFPSIIIQSFKLLCKIPFVLRDKIIKPDSEVETLFQLVINRTSTNTQLNQEIISFIITYYISNCLNSGEDINRQSFLITTQRSFSNKIEELFRQFWENDNEDMKFQLSCLFLVISANRDIWVYLMSQNMINATKSNIIDYIKKTFNPSKIKQNDTNAEYSQRIRRIIKLIDIFLFISNETVYNTIQHIKLFSTYFEVVILLFYINAPVIRLDVLKILNTLTLFNECKMLFLEKSYASVHMKLYQRLEQLFAEIEKVNALAEDLSVQKMEVMVKLEKSQEEYKQKLNENYALLDSLFNHAKQSFLSAGNEFGLLISIFVNLLLSNQFEPDLQVLCNGKPEKYFSFAEHLNAVSKEKITNLVEELLNDGCLIKYHKFFQKLKILKSELNKYYSYNTTLSKFVFQIPLAIIINNPSVQIVFEKEKVLSECLGDLMNINTVIELIKTNKGDFDLLHKLIFAANRLLSKQGEYKPIIESIKKLIEELRKIISMKNLPTFVARECFRICCTLTSGIDSCALWLKFDSNKHNVDCSNTNDIVLKYMKDDLNWNQRNGVLLPLGNGGTTEGRESKESHEHAHAHGHGHGNNKNEQLIMLPYQKYKAYNDKMGIIIQSPFHFLLPKPLNLSNEIDTSFTVWFRLFNAPPQKQHKGWHTLLQDKKGLISLIAIDSAYRRIGCFSNKGEFIDSGIDLWNKDISNKWIQLAMAFQSLGTAGDKKVTGEITWYLNGKARPKRGKVQQFVNGELIEYLTNKYILPSDVQYIGNSRDFTEPFGIICDLRIYKRYKEPEQIAYLYQLKDSIQNYETHDLDMEYLLYHNLKDDQNDVCISFVLDNDFISQEVLFYVVVFFNNLMSNKDYRQKFYNFKLVMKLCEEGFLYDSNDIKKELTKFLQILS